MKLQNKDLASLLSKRKFFKLDLNNLDIDKNYLGNLLYIFTLAGCSAIDINSHQQDLKKVKNFIEAALKKAKNLKIDLISKPLIVSSFYKESLQSKKFDLKKTINEAIQNGSNIIELHLSELSTGVAIQVINQIKDISNELILSICISRENHSNASIVEIIKLARDIVGNNLIVEVESFSSPTNKNQFNSTLQTLSTADIIYKQLKNKEIKYRRLPLIISGGTNNQTSELAHKCGVKYNGITFGEYAINVVNKSIFNDHKLKNDELLSEINHLKDFIENSFSV